MVTKQPKKIKVNKRELKAEINKLQMEKDNQFRLDSQVKMKLNTQKEIMDVRLASIQINQKLKKIEKELERIKPEDKDYVLPSMFLDEYHTPMTYEELEADFNILLHKLKNLISKENQLQQQLLNMGLTKTEIDEILTGKFIK